MINRSFSFKDTPQALKISLMGVPILANNNLTMLRIEVEWSGETGGPVNLLNDDGIPQQIAFDHSDILGMAVKRIRGKLDYVPIGFQLLPDRFTLLLLLTILSFPKGREQRSRSLSLCGEAIGGALSAP